MNRRDFVKLCGVGLYSLSLGGCSGWIKKEKAIRKPNIILIMADDLGFSDLGCYGSEIKTPNLDKIAADGIRFTKFYNAARCCPSRASLLTGLYPHQAGLGYMNSDLGYPAYTGNLSHNAVTLSQLLKLGGYKTFMCGKWHVVHPCLSKERIDTWPCQRGFDRYYGTLGGYTSQWDPIGLVEDNEFVKADKEFLYTEAMTDKAIEYIDSAEDTPFFLYLAYTAPHYPLHAREETIKKYKGVYDVGWENIRLNRFKKMKELGIVPEDMKMQELDPASHPWEQEKHKQWQARRMQTFAAMIDEMDQGIGRIIQRLKSKGQLENTLIVFLSDNGGSCEGHLNNTIERTGEPWESSLIPKTTPDGKPVIAGDIPGVDLGAANTFGSYGLDWASVSNTPFRRHKSWVHEGGISTPCIMHWPKGIKEASLNKNDICHIIDIMPTFAEIAQVDYPENYNGYKIQPMEGKSLVDVFKGLPLKQNVLFWEHEGNRAINDGKFKLVSEFPGEWLSFYPQQTGHWELYDIQNDRGELNDLSQKYPDEVIRLKNLYDHWADRTGVVNWQNIDKSKL